MTNAVRLLSHKALFVKGAFAIRLNQLGAFIGRVYRVVVECGIKTVCYELACVVLKFRQNLTSPFRGMCCKGESIYLEQLQSPQSIPTYRFKNVVCDKSLNL